MDLIGIGWWRAVGFLTWVAEAAVSRILSLVGKGASVEV